MHLTPPHIHSGCSVISTVMEIDKSEPPYHNPTYITEGGSIFREVEANELG